MKIISGTTEFTYALPSVVTIGKFDGLHRGHQQLFRRIRELGAQGYGTVVFTFDRQPATVISHKAVPLIMTKEELEAELDKQKIDMMIECPFTDEIRHMEPEDFVEKILCQRLHMKYLVVGADFRFGYKGKGNCDYLISHAEECGYEINVIPCELYNGEKISSTMIREEITKGDLHTANYLLGHSYKFCGTIVEGKHIGHKIGVPTLNVLPDPIKVLPPNGVYAAVARLEDGNVITGVANLGVNPTISDNNRKTLEMHLFDFHDTIYQQTVEISLLKFMRPEQKFASIEDLRKQLTIDIASAEKLFKES